ncbi:MAG: TauD/TfdA family dioxygenase [Candidatus Binatia bacterium]
MHAAPSASATGVAIPATGVAGPPPLPESCPYEVRPLASHPDRLPLVISANGDTDVGRLAAWLTSNGPWVREQLRSWGALLFRGFAVTDAAAFETVARSVDDDLKNEYLGTSPRNALTAHVFTASELPPFYPIPQHCEMSFTKNPPRRLFFTCLVESAAGCGETPLCDFRRVLADLDPDLVARFEKRGIRVVRNYAGAGSTSRFNPFQLKRWDEMFLTTDRAAVEAKCREEGFEPVWTGADGLRLVSTQPVTRVHPETGEKVWHNHVTTFHPSQAAGEYRRIHALRPTLKHWALLQVSRLLESLERRRPGDELAMNCTHLDGSPIADADIEAVREAVWKHLVVHPWKQGDVVAIDNYAVSHGRLPYSGQRLIAVAWA